MQGIIKTKDFEIEYFIYGSGEKVLFAFHGFNNHATNFAPLGTCLSDNFKTISLNLLFHGESKANEDVVENGFSKKNAKELFDALLVLFPAEKVYLAGFSIGGRFALWISELFPEKISQLFLLAPDGIRISPFYWLVTQNKWGRRLLKWVIDKPSLFIQGSKMLRSMRFINMKKYKFAHSNFDTRAKRKKVFLVWSVYRKAHIDLAGYKNILVQHQIKVFLFYGKYDRIILPETGDKVRKDVEGLVSVHLVETGHQLLREKTLQEISKIIRGIN